MSHFKMPEDFILPGEKPAILLLHAYTGSTADVRLIAGALNRAGYYVTSLNFKGHATMHPSDILIQGSPTVWRDQVSDKIKELRKNFGSSIFVFGLSLGGIFAIDVLENNPDLLGGGVFSSPIFSNNKKTSRTLPIGFLNYTRAIQKLDQDSSNAEKNSELNYIEKNLAVQLQEINDLQKKVEKKLATIFAPVFIGQAGQDEIVDQDEAYVLRDNLMNCKNITFKWYDNASHVITTNNARKELEKDVLEFIQNNYHEVTK